MSRLERFKHAQASAHAGYDAALREIVGGRKRGHWIWYVLPQLRGLGSSPNAETYGIDGRDEAIDYLADEELRGRLLEISTSILGHLESGASLRALMASEIDAMKTVSSLTLFGLVAERMPRSRETTQLEDLARIANEILAIAAAQGYPRCERTLRALATK
jgi:uncharacterized protein (DUF1810 family)